MLKEYVGVEKAKELDDQFIKWVTVNGWGFHAFGHPTKDKFVLKRGKTIQEVTKAELMEQLKRF